MFRKSKICITVLALYEIFAVCWLYWPITCDMTLGRMFCMSGFRYFVFCAALPIVVMLAWMWIASAVRAHRRRRFIRRAKGALHGLISGIRGRVMENISAADIERLLIAGALFAIQRYINRHPNLQRDINNVMDLADGTIDMSEFSASETLRAARRKPRRPESKRTSRRGK